MDMGSLRRVTYLRRLEVLNGKLPQCLPPTQAHSSTLEVIDRKLHWHMQAASCLLHFCLMILTALSAQSVWVICHPSCF